MLTVFRMIYSMHDQDNNSGSVRYPDSPLQSLHPPLAAANAHGTAHVPVVQIEVLEQRARARTQARAEGGVV